MDRQLPKQVFHTFLNGSKRARNLEKLSRQELEILLLLAQGMSNKEIGLRLHITEKTVRNHLTHVFRKLGVARRQQAVGYFLGNRKRAG